MPNMQGPRTLPRDEGETVSKFTQAWFDAQQAKRNNSAMYSPPSEGATNESALHDAISAYCRSKGWLAIHSRMDTATTTAKGVPDFVIFADNGRVFLVECKTRLGKLSPDQAAWHAMAKRNGHEVHTVRSFEEFLETMKEVRTK